MFRKKLDMVFQAVADVYPEAKFLYHEDDETAVIYFNRTQILIQNSPTKEQASSVHLMFEKFSSPKIVTSISLFVSKIFKQVSIGDNFEINDKGECVSFIEAEDRPQKGDTFH